MSALFESCSARPWYPECDMGQLLYLSVTLCIASMYPYRLPSTTSITYRLRQSIEIIVGFTAVVRCKIYLERLI